MTRFREDIEAIMREMEKKGGGPAFTPLAVVYAQLEQACRREDKRSVRKPKRFQKREAKR